MCRAERGLQLTVRVSRETAARIDAHAQRLRAELPGHICRSHALTDLFDLGVADAEAEDAFRTFNNQLPEAAR